MTQGGSSLAVMVSVAAVCAAAGVVWLAHRLISWMWRRAGLKSAQDFATSERTRRTIRDADAEH